MRVQQRRRPRFPVTTAAVFAVTAATNAAQFAVPGMLAAWQRTPAGLHDQWWRSFSALLVQDGGVLGTVSNLAFLLVLGALAEQVLRPARWLGCYLGAGLVGELAGYAWQPHGGGNSIAVCGLAGALVVAIRRDTPLPAVPRDAPLPAVLRDSPVPAVTARDAADPVAPLPAVTPVAVLYWCGALLATIAVPLLAVGLVAGALVQLCAGRGLPVARPAAAAAVLAGLALVAARNLHGPALLAGIALGALLGDPPRANRSFPQPPRPGVSKPNPAAG